jgi:ligand-binding SRPBCC domain-containing protein
VTWRARHFGRTWTLTSRVTEFDAPHRLVDEQVRGPFRSFRHQHDFIPLVAGGTRMLDDWSHVAPLGLLGRLADRLVLTRHMSRLLEVRNAAIKREAETRADQ